MTALCSAPARRRPPAGGHRQITHPRYLPRDVEIAQHVIGDDQIKFVIQTILVATPFCSRHARLSSAARESLISSSQIISTLRVWRAANTLKANRVGTRAGARPRARHHGTLSMILYPLCAGTENRRDSGRPRPRSPFCSPSRRRVKFGLCLMSLFGFLTWRRFSPEGQGQKWAGHVRPQWARRGC